ncbi:MAG: MFS transporter [Gammaproteobacteria bacterium]|jgi:MFS family permease|nr:MFS transporter [Gammaproteobacteria bacterium]MDP6616623.1 MFS transporter [Gammaproteobacteria bacterium]MDP6694820.1 MFS transporter [Gammaproteobacteria bacterium]
MEDTQPAQAGAGSGKARTILLAGLITYGIGQSLLYIIFAPLVREIGLPEWQIGVLISASNVAILFSAPLWGKTSDRIGRRTVFVIGLLGYAAGYGGLAFGVQAGIWGVIVATPLFLTLLAARLVYGVFAGGVQPAAQAYIADTTDESSRAQGMALVAASGGIGTIIGPIFGGLLAEISSLFPMYAAAALGLGSALWAQFGLIEPETHASNENREGMFKVFGRIFPYLLGWFVIFMVFTSIQIVATFFVSDQIGIDTTPGIIRVTSTAFFCMAIVTVIMQVLVMQVWKMQPKILLRSAFIIFGLVLLGMTQVEGLFGLYLVFAGMGFAVSLAMPSLSAAASLSVGPQEQGAAAGLLAAAPTFGMVFGPATGALMYEIDTLLPMQVGAVMTILTGIYFWFVRIPSTAKEDRT